MTCDPGDAHLGVCAPGKLHKPHISPQPPVRSTQRLILSQAKPLLLSPLAVMTTLLLPSAPTSPSRFSSLSLRNHFHTHKHILFRRYGPTESRTPCQHLNGFAHQQHASGSARISVKPRPIRRSPPVRPPSSSDLGSLGLSCTSRRC